MHVVLPDLLKHQTFLLITTRVMTMLHCRSLLYMTLYKVGILFADWKSKMVPPHDEINVVSMEKIFQNLSSLNHWKQTWLRCSLDIKYLFCVDQKWLLWQDLNSTYGKLKNLFPHKKPKLYLNDHWKVPYSMFSFFVSIINHSLLPL